MKKESNFLSCLALFIVIVLYIYSSYKKMGMMGITLQQPISLLGNWLYCFSSIQYFKIRGAQKTAFFRIIKTRPVVLFTLLLLFSIMPGFIYAGPFSASDTSKNSNETIAVYRVSATGFTGNDVNIADSMSTIIEKELEAEGGFSVINRHSFSAADSAENNKPIDSILDEGFNNGANTILIAHVIIIPERKMAKRCGCYQAKDSVIEVSNKPGTITSVKLRFAYQLIDVLSGNIKQVGEFTSNTSGNHIGVVIKDACNKAGMRIRQELAAYKSKRIAEDHWVVQ